MQIKVYTLSTNPRMTKLALLSFGVFCEKFKIKNTHKLIVNGYTNQKTVQIKKKTWYT